MQDDTVKLNEFFQYAIIKYIPDAFTTEFVNIGLIGVYENQAYLILNLDMTRVNLFFDNSISEQNFHYITNSLISMVKELNTGPIQSIDKIINQHMFMDETLKCENVGGGIIHNNFENEIMVLFDRLIIRYNSVKLDHYTIYR